jgi:trk system potassium uptake protein TrkH
MKDIEFHPARALAASFLAAILVGTVVLSLPFCTTEGHSTSVLDAVFTATSAVCVTGLIVKDTPVHFSAAGQAVILVLIQLGGLGIMTFSTLILLAARRKVSVRERLLIQSSFHPGIPKDFPSLVRSIFLFTFGIEAAGAAVLFLWFTPRFGAQRGLELAVFHSISAFCNAGFSLFSDSLAGYGGHAGLVLTVAALIVLGGIGFPVLRESAAMIRARARGRRFQPTLHFKLVVATTLILIISGGAGLFVLEQGASMASYPAGEKVLASLFQGITARTAGFNTIPIEALGPASVLLMILLMFVGASPASTGGGIKTTTVAVLALIVRARARARDTVPAFHRTLGAELAVRAVTLIVLGLSVTFVAGVALLMAQPEIGMANALFEVFSAFGTVGLTTGITPGLTPAGRIIIILTMFVGRVGPLTILYALSRRKPRGHYEYAEESVLVG